MKAMKLLLTIGAAALFAVAGSRTAKADAWDQATKLTFSGPVEVPGLALPAGTYWFTLADSDSDRNIVQVWNEDRTQLLKTILAIPDYRLQPTGKTVINFEERPRDAPEAIHSWFYPGANHGEEFVYPKTRAVQLAKQTSRPVLSMRDEQASSAATDIKQVKQTPVMAMTPSGEEVEIAEVFATQDVVAQAAPPGPLPKTGSTLPLLACIGLTAVCTALGLRLAVQRMG
jgi:hypothetical protein